MNAKHTLTSVLSLAAVSLLTYFCYQQIKAPQESIQNLYPTVKATQPSQLETHIPTTSTLTPPAHQPAPIIADFSEWLDQRPATDAPNYQAWIEQGKPLAQKRAAHIQQLIQNNPSQALAAALTWSQYAQLPTAIQNTVEAPFSAEKEIHVYPNCQGPVPEIPFFEIASNNQTLTAYVTPERKHAQSKHNALLSGIQINGISALHPQTFVQITIEDAAAAQAIIHASYHQPDTQKDFLTGQPILDQPVIAIAGGALFAFANAENLKAANAKASEWNHLPGPLVSDALFLEPTYLPAPAANTTADTTGFDLTAADNNAQYAASTWTETPKDVLFIRVVFPDLLTESISQASLDSILNGDVSNQIDDMSYGKTNIVATVSSTTILLPSPTTTYLPNNNSLLYTDALAAYTSQTGLSTSGYDIVGIHFEWIEMESSNGLKYGGLAGGSRQWLQGTESSEVIVHEFGHNYGLGHARYWDTNNGTSVGAGTTEEYGNPYDVMGSGPLPEGHFGARSKEYLNWLETTQWLELSSANSGQHRIYGIDQANTTGSLRGIRAIKDSNDYYWLHFRSSTTEDDLVNGAVLNWQQGTSSASWLVDTTPDSQSSNDQDDAPLRIGRTYSDTTADVHFTPVASGGTGVDAYLDIVANTGVSSGNQAPTGSLSVPATIRARQSYTLTATASDPDGDNLAYDWDLNQSAPPNNSATYNATFNTSTATTVDLTVSDMKGGTLLLQETLNIDDPLDNFTERSLDDTSYINTAYYKNGRHFGFGLQDVFTSLDGTTWQDTYLGLNVRMKDVVENEDGLIVAVGQDYYDSAWRAAIVHSADGVNWTVTRFSQYGTLYSIDYGAGRFVAVGENGVILSADADLNWTLEASGETEDIDDIVYANGQFLAVGGETESIILSSSDGTSWQDQTANDELGQYQYFEHMDHKDGRYVAGGINSGLRYSDDLGLTWTIASLPTTGTYRVEDVVAFSEGFIVRATLDSVDVILISADGIHFAYPPASMPTNGPIYESNGRITVMHDTGRISDSDPLNTTNNAPTATPSIPTTGQARYKQTFTANGSDIDGDPLHYWWDFGDGSAPVYGASQTTRYTTPGTYTVTLHITDDQGGSHTETQTITIDSPVDDWTQRTSNTTNQLTALATNGSLAVAVGTRAIRTSTDGTTWSTVTTGSNEIFKDVTYNNGLFVVVGQDYDFSINSWVGLIKTSSNGTTWTQRHFGGNVLQGVAGNANGFIAVGNSGTSMESSDGLTWTLGSTGTTITLYDITYHEDRFVTVGGDFSTTPLVLYTLDNGNNWNDASSGADLANWHAFRSVDYLYDRFVASGWYTELKYSTDKALTFTTQATTTYEVYGWAFGNGIYYAAAVYRGGTNDNTPINLFSINGSDWFESTASNTAILYDALFFNDTFIAVGASGNIWQSDTIPDIGWRSWHMTQFGTNYYNFDPTGNDDTDTYPNLLEFALNRDPLNAEPPISNFFTQQSGNLKIELDRNPDAVDIDWTLWESADLTNWQLSELTPTVNTDTRLEYNLGTPNSPEPKFYQLRIDLAD